MMHTPTPWRVRGLTDSGHCVFGLRPGDICVGETFHNKRAEADAAFIVRAVNVYDKNQERIAGLKAIIQQIIASLSHGVSTKAVLELARKAIKEEGCQ